VTRPFIALLLLASSFAVPQVSPPDVLITIKVLNGKNGKPVWRESPNVYIGDSTENVNPRTDRHGEAKLRIPADAESIKITPNWGHECRPSNARSYSVAEILAKGVVAENSCGTSRVNPTPGVLVFYERPSTWWERTWD
jgi:hypothetical protein